MNKKNEGKTNSEENKLLNGIKAKSTKNLNLGETKVTSSLPGIFSSYLKDVYVTGVPITFSTLSTSVSFLDKSSIPISVITKSKIPYDTITISPASSTIVFEADLQEKISKLKNDLTEALTELDKIKDQKEVLSAKIKDFKVKQEELALQESFQFLMSRVNEDAKEKLSGSEKFRNLFYTEESREVVVISIDIRRSTELMLKAKTPKLYAEYITSLSKILTQIIIKNYGIFDKFTGDGILAYFPDFYSGPDALLYALRSAVLCHNAFKEHYAAHRHCFSTVLTDVGLGIGIDLGGAHLVRLDSEITVVGNPVVYACRFSSADFGETYLNQSAYEAILQNYEEKCSLDETTINLKHEGNAIAYKVTEFLPESVSIDAPDWDSLITKFHKID